jgi:GT2 family glycosyltransferase
LAEYEAGTRVLVPVADSNEPLTVAIPFYKGHAFLRAAIESVLRQTSPEWRLLICDDGPEAGTAALVESYRDPRIRYLKNDRNLGMAGNWNRCLDAAGANLVNLLHNDDELLPGYVELMRQAAREHPDAAAFFCRARIIDASGRSRFSPIDYVKKFLQPRTEGPLTLQGPAAIEALMRGNFIMCPTVCYRKSRLGNLRFSSAWRFALDLEFYVRLLLTGEKIIGLPDVAYAYRRHEANATEAYTASLLRFEEESRLHDWVAGVASQRGWSRLAALAARKRVIQGHLLFRIAGDIAFCRLGAAGQKWKFLRHLSGGRIAGRPALGLLDRNVPDQLRDLPLHPDQSRVKEERGA